jgi:hypothetical protein
VLQFHVPELVDRACLPQNAPPVGISKEAHQLPWRLMMQRK